VQCPGNEKTKHSVIRSTALCHFRIPSLSFQFFKGSATVAPNQTENYPHSQFTFMEKDSNSEITYTAELEWLGALSYR
jgi:hypothetical protein